MSYLYPCWLVPSKKAQGNTFVVVKEYDDLKKRRLGQLSELSCKDGGTYQKIDGAAHAVVTAVVAHHCAVIEETNEESLHQGDKVLHLWPQRGFLSSAVQQAGRQASTS